MRSNSAGHQPVRGATETTCSTSTWKTTMTEKRACLGGKTKPCRFSDLGHAQACLSCGTRIRDDLVDHPFFGFATSCPMSVAPPPADAPSSV